MKNNYLYYLKKAQTLKKRAKMMTNTTAYDKGSNQIQEIKKVDEKEEAITDEYGNVEYEFSHTWSCGIYGIMILYNYFISRYLNDNCSDKMTLKEEVVKGLVLPGGKRYNLITRGTVIYSIDNKLVSFDADGWYVKIQSEKDISKFIREIDYSMLNKNPYSGNNFNIIGSDSESELELMNVDKITFDDVILDEKIKTDIIDNTIFQLKNINGSNGIILYGKPGVGKSRVCSAIANESNKEDITTITLTHNPNFEFIRNLIDIFFKKTIIFLEDIDGIGESRRTGNYSNQISELLNFINGVGTMKNDMVFIATTNHLDLLDDAIKNRPVRFNRILEIALPNEILLKKLFGYYFSEDLQDIYNEYCNKNGKLKLTGSHVKEISRTAKILSLKRKTEVRNVLKESIDTVIKSFNTTIDTHIGFNT